MLVEVAQRGRAEREAEAEAEAEVEVGDNTYLYSTDGSRA